MTYIIPGALGRPDWLTRHLGQVPMLLLHIREHALPSLQANAEPRVSGSKEQTTAPLNIDPIDHADELWGEVCALAIDYADRSGDWKGLPDALDRQWRIATSAQFSVVGFSSSDPDRIYADVVDVTRYLIERAWTLAINQQYQIPVDELVASIQSARRRYPDAPSFAPHRHRCPKCLLHGVVPDYSESGEILALRCERCGARRNFGGE
ncbi:hypothetical protein H490_0103975 [Leucobacter sp. UCD-THU]|uniref:hypothetical protein n=1 Tax=Leucobacter sp. UCD-THU TaxID=1292023 RepID=UPI000382C76D|nr:hypothetical protein [Leucobacter sp. UCD-THU]EYT55801.1 hypothetical protein H490_0103975 [Leucobacter sp. UCD-THU]